MSEQMALTSPLPTARRRLLLLPEQAEADAHAAPDRPRVRRYRLAHLGSSAGLDMVDRAPLGIGRHGYLRRTYD